MNSLPNWAPWVALGFVGWVFLPFIIPLFIFYCVARTVHVMMIGKAVEEVHNEK